MRNIVMDTIIPPSPKVIPGEQFMLYAPIASLNSYGMVKLAPSDDGVVYLQTDNGILKLRVDKLREITDPAIAAAESASESEARVVEHAQQVEDNYNRSNDLLLNFRNTIMIDTVSINQDGKLVIRTKDGSTYVSAEMVKGDPFTFEDFTAEQLESIRGPRGFMGPEGPAGKPFRAAKVYSSVIEMQNSFDTDGVAVGEYVIISTPDVNDPDNSKVYVKTETKYNFLTDMSGKEGIQGPQGPRGDGTVVTKDGVAQSTWDADKVVPRITHSADFSKAYVESPDGDVQLITVSQNSYTNTIVQRVQGGWIRAKEPTEDDHVVNLKYLKTYVADELAKIPNAKGVSF